jgi:two-component sensor histidine kinase/HAMP domain-containing protein
MKYQFNKIFSTLSTKKIIWRTTLWTWGLIIITIIIFVIYTIPFQRETVLERMENEATDIAASILHANSSALITEDYGAVVDQCLQLVSNSKSILYVVITKNDGYSLVHTQNKWFDTKYDGMWLPDTSNTKGKIIISKLIDREVYHKSYRVAFSNVEWGWIHIGLSLENYQKSLSDIRRSTTEITILMSIFGLIAAILFARRLTKPITILDRTTKLIAEGDLSAKAEIKTHDELQSLSVSFNKMTNKLKEERDLLESRVQERTSALVEANNAMIDEIQERKKIEESLHNSLEEKDVLFKEIHHRVKNNLQIISSLLFLQSSHIKDEETQNVFHESQNRIRAMALVHEKLYQSKDMSRVNFGEYINNLSAFLYQTYRNKNFDIEFKYDVDNIFVSVDLAISLGLILNELLSNALKYAFKDVTHDDKHKNYISINSKKNDNLVVFEIIDNGIGLPQDFDIEKSESLGLKLVKSLTHQINGKLNIESNAGTKFTIIFYHG